LSAPSEETALVQQVHLVAAHAICGLVESAIFANPAAGKPKTNLDPSS
jgi:D-sedoheptulose 7-phosphate isomerase